MSSICLVIDDDVGTEPQQNHNATRRSSFHSTSCGVLTIGEDHQTVYFPELNLSSIATFKFDQVLPQGFTPSEAYSACAASLTSSLLSGSDACLLLLGSSSSGASSLLEGPTGFLQHCSSDLLRLASSRGGPAARLRLSLSWCALDASRSEGLLDLVKSASAPVDLPPAIDPSLSVQPGRGGRGASVRGLWEVELGAAADVPALVARVRANEGTFNPNFHHVVSLHLDRLQVSTAHISKGRPQKNAPADERSTLSFLVLAPLCQQPGYEQRLEALLSPPYRLSSPFSESRLLQHLSALFPEWPPSTGPRRGATSSLFAPSFPRPACAVVSVLDPSLDCAPVTLKALRLGTLLSSLASSCARPPSELQHFRADRPSSPSSPSGAAPGLSHADLAEDNDNDNNSNEDDYNYAAAAASAAPVTSVTSAPPPVPSRDGRLALPVPQPDLASRRPPSSASAAPVVSENRLKLNVNVPSSASAAAEPPPPPPPVDPYNLHVNHPSALLNSPTTAANVVVPATLYRALEGKQARVTALESELASLKVLVSTLSADREDLLARLSDDGGTLKAKDRVLLRQALSDVKDYEVYKDVMEQTFQRMKSDIGNLTADRDRALHRAEKLEASRRAAATAATSAKRSTAKADEDLAALSSARDAAIRERDEARVERGETERKHKHALKEIVRLKSLLAERDEDLAAVNARASRNVAAGVGYAVGRVSAATTEAIKRRQIEARANASANASFSSHAMNSSKSVLSSRTDIQESLARAEENLLAARQIMFN